MNGIQVLNMAALVANRFRGACLNCGYGDTSNHRCPFCLVANDIERTKAVVTSKYPSATKHIDEIAQSHPEKAVEWVAKSLHRGSGIYPEDKQRFNEAWQFHQANKGNPRFREAATRLYPGTNPKNPLDYTLYHMEGIQDEMRTPEEKAASKRELLRSEKHEGASTYYEDPTYKIV